MTEQIETEVLSVEESIYRSLSCKLSLLDARIEEAELALQNHVFGNPRMTALAGTTVLHSDGRRDELEAEIRRLYLERQVLLPQVATLKFSLGLSR
jgi:hypothetical protein